MLERIRPVFHNQFTNRKEFELSRGSRPWHVLLILCEGSFRFTVDGVCHVIEKDEIALFPQSKYFEREVISPIGFHQIGFLLETEADDNSLGCAGKLEIPPSHVRALIETMDRLSVSPSEKTVYAQLVAHVLLEHRVHRTPTGHETAGEDRDVAFAVRYMTEHIGEKLRIEEIARMIPISRVALFGKFKRYMGCTPSDFLIRLRMQYAKHLLLESDLRINEIASLCGYSNAYYFSNAFKSFYGIAPSGFSKKMYAMSEKKNEPYP